MKYDLVETQINLKVCLVFEKMFSIFMFLLLIGIIKMKIENVFSNQAEPLNMETYRLLFVSSPRSLRDAKWQFV